MVARRLPASEGLTDDEIVLLDQRCRPHIQRAVDAAKRRVAAREQYPDLSFAQAGVVADVLELARDKGKIFLDVTHRLTYCELCDTRAGYVPFKSGPRKGQANTKRPLFLNGSRIAAAPTSYLDRLEGCSACMSPVIPVLREELEHVPCERSENLFLNVHSVRYQRIQRATCETCGWEGTEKELTGRFGDCPQRTQYDPHRIEVGPEFTLLSDVEVALMR